MNISGPAPLPLVLDTYQFDAQFSRLISELFPLKCTLSPRRCWVAGTSFLLNRWLVAIMCSSCVVLSLFIVLFVVNKTTLRGVLLAEALLRQTRDFWGKSNSWVAMIWNLLLSLSVWKALQLYMWCCNQNAVALAAASFWFTADICWRPELHLLLTGNLYYTCNARKLICCAQFSRFIATWTTLLEQIPTLCCRKCYFKISYFSNF